MLFAIGHFGIGYLIGKASSRLFDVKLNLGLLFSISVLPDIDLLLFSFIKHRGPLHSIFFSLVVCVPFFIIYQKKVFPYFFALLSHSLVGDIFSGGLQLFWPFSTNWISILDLSVRGSVSASMELIIFIATIFVIIMSKDYQKLLFNRTRRIYWLIPFGAVLMPLLSTFNNYVNLPFLLVVPSLFYLVLFSYLFIGSNLLKKT